MLFAYVFRATESTRSMELCLVPKENSPHAQPVPVDLLDDNPGAVYYIGPREGVIVNREGPTQRILTAVSPAVFFLTPDSPERPGQKAMQLKIVNHSDGSIETYFTRDSSSDWEPWVANRRREQFD